MKPIRAWYKFVDVNPQGYKTESTERVWILAFLFTDKFGGFSVVYADEKTGQIEVSNCPEQFKINIDFINNGR